MQFVSRIAVCLILTMLVVSASAAEATKKRLVATIDCTKEYGPEKYFALGSTKVVNTPLGSYREAEAKPEMRFGYRFSIEKVGKPHLVVIRYPDDKRRSMSMIDGTCYDLSTAVYARPSQPVSGKMLEIHQVFWPRWRDCSLVFENPHAASPFGSVADGSGPAAASSVRVYELNDFPVAVAPGDSNDGTRRQFGVEFEDPCGTSASLGATTFQQWLDRTIVYFHYSGQKTLAYPIDWYAGPLFPAKGEPAGYFDWSVAAPDRTLYIRWTTQPDDWVAPLLERFGREKLEFRAVLTLLRLGSLMEKMNTDLASIKAGKDTINNMLSTNLVQAGVNDWTTEYNVRNFAQLAEFRESGKDLATFPWAYGERQEGAVGRGPIFNPLHPVVQKAILAHFQEIAERYGQYPAFRGVNLNLWAPTILWFGSLQSGYDDYTVGLFQKETGVTVPVDPKAPDRFSKRHAFLTGNVQPKWVAWRCRKVRDLLCSIRDIFVAARPDLTVTINMEGANLEYHRLGGFDASLFKTERGIVLDRSFASQEQPPDDGDRVANVFGGVLIFNSWIENWGRHKWLVCKPDDTQAARMATIMGKPAEGICRMGSEYAKDGFWWNSQLRITSAFQAGIHFMERYAHAVAEYDACSITRGGLYLDTAHAEMIQPFAAAYRALPAKRFDTVGGSTDPVAVRTLVRDGRRYLYLVNREYYPVTVEVRLKNTTGKAVDLATSQSVDAPTQWRLTLEPYQLRSFSLSDDVEAAGFTATPPQTIVAQLTAEVDVILERIAKAKAAGKPLPPETDGVVASLREMLKQGRLAALRRGLKCDFFVKNFP